jgi:hypothetical protein
VSASPDDFNMTSCRSCAGIGYVLTEEGAELLVFLKTFSRLSLEAAKKAPTVVDPRSFGIGPGFRVCGNCRSYEWGRDDGVVSHSCGECGSGRSNACYVEGVGLHAMSPACSFFSERVLVP